MCVCVCARMLAPMHEHCAVHGEARNSMHTTTTT